MQEANFKTHRYYLFGFYGKTNRGIICYLPLWIADDKISFTQPNLTSFSCFCKHKIEHASLKIVLNDNDGTVLII